MAAAQYMLSTNLRHRWHRFTVLLLFVGTLYVAQAGRSINPTTSADSESREILQFYAERPGTHQRPSGLLYRVLERGHGGRPGLQTTCLCKYEGRLLKGYPQGTLFDNGTTQLAPDEVITGWREAMQLMPVGSEWELMLLPELAYGQSGSPPDIPHNAALVFKLRLLSCEGVEEQTAGELEQADQNSSGAVCQTLDPSNDWFSAWVVIGGFYYWTALFVCMQYMQHRHGRPSGRCHGWRLGAALAMPCLALLDPLLGRSIPFMVLCYATLAYKEWRSAFRRRASTEEPAEPGGAADAESAVDVELCDMSAEQRLQVLEEESARQACLARAQKEAEAESCGALECGDAQESKEEERENGAQHNESGDDDDADEGEIRGQARCTCFGRRFGSVPGYIAVPVNEADSTMRQLYRSESGVAAHLINILVTVFVLCPLLTISGAFGIFLFGALFQLGALGIWTLWTVGVVVVPCWGAPYLPGTLLSAVGGLLSFGLMCGVCCNPPNRR